MASTILEVDQNLRRTLFIEKFSTIKDWQQPITNFSPVLQRTTNSFTPFSLRFFTKNFFPEVLEEGRWKDNVAREPGSATRRQRERAFPQVFPKNFFLRFLPKDVHERTGNDYRMLENAAREAGEEPDRATQRQREPKVDPTGFSSESRCHKELTEVFAKQPQSGTKGKKNSSHFSSLRKRHP